MDTPYSWIENEPGEPLPKKQRIHAPSMKSSKAIPSLSPSFPPGAPSESPEGFALSHELAFNSEMVFMSHSSLIETAVSAHGIAFFSILGDSLLQGICSFLELVDLTQIAKVSKQFNELSSNDVVWNAVYESMTRYWPCSLPGSSSTNYKVTRNFKEGCKSILQQQCLFCGCTATDETTLGSVGLSTLEHFGMRMCKQCQPQYLMTTSSAKNEYLVTDKQLSGLRSVQKEWHGKVGHLYFRGDVQRLCLERWGSLERYQTEKARRKPKPRTNNKSGATYRKVNSVEARVAAIIADRENTCPVSNFNPSCNGFIVDGIVKLHPRKQVTQILELETLRRELPNSLLAPSELLLQMEQSQAGESSPLSLVPEHDDFSTMMKYVSAVPGADKKSGSLGSVVTLSDPYITYSASMGLTLDWNRQTEGLHNSYDFTDFFV